MARISFEFFGGHWLGWLLFAGNDGFCCCYLKKRFVEFGKEAKHCLTNERKNNRKHRGGMLQAPGPDSLLSVIEESEERTTR
jgi:hypothetical protein